jgi:osmotically inducible lipoprotein OsmB
MPVSRQEIREFLADHWTLGGEPETTNTQSRDHGTKEDDMRFPTMLLLLSTLAGVAACGSDPGTRAVTGGLLGAGAGAGVSAVTGGRPATGALIGGGVGAVGGAVTR